jgi:hypothetical protein
LVGAQDLRLKVDRDAFIHSLSRYVLSICYVPDHPYFVRGAVLKTIGKNPCSHGTNNEQEEDI